MNGRLQEPPYDQEEPSMPPLARIEEIVRDCLATCSRAPHPKAPDAASNLRHHMQAIERDLYEVRDLLAALTLRTPPTSAQAHDDAIRKAAGVARFAREQVLAANQHERAYAVECVEREILSLLSDAPKATHRHKKRGTEYVLIGYGKMQAERWGTNARLDTSDGGYGFVVTDPVDMREVAIYRSATDPTEMWIRPREEFEDGRFEPLPRSTTGGAK